MNQRTRPISTLYSVMLQFTLFQMQFEPCKHAITKAALKYPATAVGAAGCAVLEAESKTQKIPVSRNKHATIKYPSDRSWGATRALQGAEQGWAQERKAIPLTHTVCFAQRENRDIDCSLTCKIYLCLLFFRFSVCLPLAAWRTRSIVKGQVLRSPFGHICQKLEYRSATLCTLKAGGGILHVNRSTLHPQRCVRGVRGFGSKLSLRRSMWQILP